VGAEFDENCQNGDSAMAQLAYHKSNPYFSTLTERYYAAYDAAFQESLRSGGGAEIDFNLYLVHPSGIVEIVF
jgi:hypothetical protein